MARITGFEEVAAGQDRLHSSVQCGFKIFSAAGAPILQLDTYGSDQRKFTGKISQSIQLDRKGAEELVAILERAFPDLRSGRA